MKYLDKKILSWHPKFKVSLWQDQGVILISESEYFHLPFDRFPYIYAIDGGKTADEIMSEQNNPPASAIFFYQIGRLRQQGYLLEGDNEIHTQYQRESARNSQQINLHAGVDVINLSSISPLLVKTWCELIKKTITDFPWVITFLLVDDFLDSRLTQVVTPLKAYCVIKITGEQIWLSPISTPKSPLDWVKLQNQLWQNQPVRNLVAKLYPKQNQTLPFLIDKPLTAENIRKLSVLLAQQCFISDQTLCLMSLVTNGVEQHPVNPYYQVNSDFSAQIAKPMVLTNCAILFDTDGGCRNISPAQTLENISSLISPITGVITHLAEVKTKENQLIKTYRTAFFKTPVYIGQITAENESFVQTCLGKGISKTQSKVSALCEAIERYSALYQGDEPLLLSKQSLLPKPSYAPQQLVPYSEKQYRQFADNTHPDSSLKQAAIPYGDAEIHWLPAWSFSQEEQVYVPLSTCFANIPFNDDQFGRWHSNGCAAGNTLEEAILQALFELIERDATAIWWYNQISAAEFDINQIPADNLNKLSETLSASHKFWVLDITTEIGVPVMVAIGQDLKTNGYSLGLGCHLQPELAAQRALTELCQLIPIRDQNGAPFDFNAIVEGDYLHPHKDVKVITPFCVPSGDIKKDINKLVDRLDELGFETLAVNYSRAHLPIKTAKVFVPGLCHIWPQLANERLYQVPMKLGWLAQAKTEATINQQGLYI